MHKLNLLSLPHIQPPPLLLIVRHKNGLRLGYSLVSPQLLRRRLQVLRQDALFELHNGRYAARLMSVVNFDWLYISKSNSLALLRAPRPSGRARCWNAVVRVVHAAFVLGGAVAGGGGRAVEEGFEEGPEAGEGGGDDGDSNFDGCLGGEEW